MNKPFHTLLLFWAVLAGFIFSPLYAGASYAASLTVTVKQVNPDSAVQTVTCTDMQKNCDLPFVINAGQPTEQSLNIHAGYMQGKLVLTFQTPNGYFYACNTVGANDRCNTLWTKQVAGSSPETYGITLLQPLVQHIVAPALSLARKISPNIAHSSVASLEITATPNP